MSTYRTKLNDFLQEWIRAERVCYDEDGYLKPEAAAAALRMLLEEGVFESPKELRKKAFEDYGILIPDRWMGV